MHGEKNIVDSGRKGAFMVPATSGKSLAHYAFGEMGFTSDAQSSSTATLRVLDRTNTIDYFGESKPQIRGGLFLQKNCAAIGMMLGIGQLVRYLYICWLDYHNDRDRQLLRALEQQTYLMVNFYGSNRQRRRLYLVDNPLIPLIEQARRHIGWLPAWTGEQFTQTLSSITLQCGDVSHLWDRLDAEVNIIQLKE